MTVLEKVQSIWPLHIDRYRCTCSVVSHSANPWTVAHQAALSMEFSRQEYWNRLPLPSPGDLPDPGIKPMFPESPALAGGFFTTAPPGKPIHADRQMLNMLAFPTY